MQYDDLLDLLKKKVPIFKCTQFSYCLYHQDIRVMSNFCLFNILLNMHARFFCFVLCLFELSVTSIAGGGVFLKE